MSFPVLMYHSISVDPNEEIPVEEIPYDLPVAEFERHLDFLTENNIRTIRIGDDEATQEPSVVLSFDDGHASDAMTALPLLLDRKMVAEFYVTTGWIGQRRYLSKSQIRELADAGMALGTHGVEHRYFDDLTAAELREELRASKNTLEDITGQKIAGGSAPGGRLHAQLQQIATEESYDYMGTSKTGLGSHPAADSTAFIPRLAILRDMPIAEFQALASADPGTLFKRRARTAILDTAKTVLGNRLYDSLRSRLLGENDQGRTG